VPNRIIRRQGRIIRNEIETCRNTLPHHSAPTRSSALKVGSSEAAQKNRPRVNSKLSIDGSPKPLGDLRRNFGEMMNTPRRGYAPKIIASNSLQLPESQILAKNTMTLGSSKSQRIEGQIQGLRGQDHPQRGTRHSPMIPSKKLGEKRPQIHESSDERKT
jgi:hypothetical protein